MTKCYKKYKKNGNVLQVDFKEDKSVHISLGEDYLPIIIPDCEDIEGIRDLINHFEGSILRSDTQIRILKGLIKHGISGSEENPTKEAIAFAKKCLTESFEIPQFQNPIARQTFEEYLNSLGVLAHQQHIPKPTIEQFKKLENEIPELVEAYHKDEQLWRNYIDYYITAREQLDNLTPKELQKYYRFRLNEVVKNKYMTKRAIETLKQLIQKPTHVKTRNEFAETAIKNFTAKEMVVVSALISIIYKKKQRKEINNYYDLTTIALAEVYKECGLKQRIKHGGYHPKQTKEIQEILSGVILKKIIANCEFITHEVTIKQKKIRHLTHIKLKLRINVSLTDQDGNFFLHNHQAFLKFRNINGTNIGWKIVVYSEKALLSLRDEAKGINLPTLINKLILDKQYTEDKKRTEQQIKRAFNDMVKAGFITKWDCKNSYNGNIKYTLHNAKYMPKSNILKFRKVKNPEIAKKRYKRV